MKDGKSDGNKDGLSHLDQPARSKRKRDIAEVTNLRKKPVYLFSGTKDNVVYQPVMKAVLAQLSALGASS